METIDNDKSGSCAIVAISIDDHLYVANVGDSWAIMQQGNKMVELSHDHKPGDPNEQAWIEKNGG